MKGIRCPRFRIYGAQWHGDTRALFTQAGLTAHGKPRKLPRCIPGLSRDKKAYNRWYRSQNP